MYIFQTAFIHVSLFVRAIVLNFKEKKLNKKYGSKYFIICIIMNMYYYQIQRKSDQKTIFLNVNMTLLRVEIQKIIISYDLH